MKWLFSTLLIANLGMLIWLIPQTDNASTIEPLMADIGELRLVDEPKETQPIPEATALEPLPQPAERHESQITPSDEPETADLAALAPPQEEPAALEIPPPPPTPICGQVGEFDKRSHAELLSVRMLAQGARTEITSETSNRQAGFWVLIPPQGNRQSAIAVAKELEAVGITDLWRFTSGNLAHAISLGLFTDEERAQARRDKIAGMGFNPEVRPRYREQTRYRLEYRYTGKPPLNADNWREITRKYPEIERQEKPCS